MMNDDNKAWVLTGTEQFTLTQLARPALAEGWLRLSPKYCGVCGSDLHSYKGLHPMVHPPIILGHEFSGTVTEIGETVSPQLLGAHVVAIPSLPCGACYQCLHGQEHICAHLQVVGNIGIEGALAGYVDVPAGRILRIPEDMDLAEAALVEPVAVAVHALNRSSDIPDLGVIVMGAGPIGLLTALVAKSQGIGPVTIIDIQESRLAVALELGIDFAIDSCNQDLVATIKHIYPDGAGAIFDCVAIPETLNQALRLARKGSTVVLEGVPVGPMMLDAILVQDRELSIVGTLMYQLPDFQKAIDLIYQKQIPLSRVITREVNFDDVPSVFWQLVHEPGRDIKVLVKI